MSIKYFCDRCGEETKNYCSGLPTIYLKNDGFCYHGKGKPALLCNDCCKSLQAWFDLCKKEK